MTFRSLGDALPSNRDLLARVQGMAERAIGKSRSQDVPKPPLAAQLPAWGDEIRGMANEVLRSSLFNARNRNQPRQYLKNEAIAIIDKSASIIYTGEELRQNDESVWLQLIHMARKVPIGSPVEFTPYEMVQALRVAKSKPNKGHRKRLFESLRRRRSSPPPCRSAGAGCRRRP